MIHLNSDAKEAMNISNVNSCTDITGYGLLGHLLEMCLGSDVSAETYTLSFNTASANFVGDVISCYADIIRTGRTSITVKVEVYAERNPINKKIVKVTEAELTYVALDENRRPRKLPNIDD